MREQIRDAVAALLTSMTTTPDANVFTDRQYALDVWPSIVVRTTEETVADDPSTIGKAHIRNLTIVIECRAKVGVDDTPSLSHTLDDMAAEVEPLIATDPTLGGLLGGGYMELESTAIEQDAAADKPSGMATLEYRASYRTLEQNPTAIP